MKIGFARTSTTHQKFGLENQIELLEKEGCEKIFHEQVSAVASKRPEFRNAIEFAREGDTFVVSTLSRFGRSMKDLLNHYEELDEKGVSLKVLDINVDTSTATGKLIFNIFASVYTWEREIMLERQQIGIQKAKEEGRFAGRVPTARNKSAEIVELISQGKTANEVAKELGIGVASVYRYKKRVA